jgi:hypothetical protein
MSTEAERRQRQLAPIKTGLYVRATSGTRLRDRRVGRLVAKVREVLPWLGIEDEPAIRGWAQLEVLATLVFADLRTRGIVNAQGEPRRLVTEFRHLRQAQLAYERELGMTPSARAALRIERRAAEVPTLTAHIAAFDARRPTPTRWVRESRGQESRSRGDHRRTPRAPRPDAEPRREEMTGPTSVRPKPAPAPRRETDAERVDREAREHRDGPRTDGDTPCDVPRGARGERLPRLPNPASAHGTHW